MELRFAGILVCCTLLATIRPCAGALDQSFEITSSSYGGTSTSGRVEQGFSAAQVFTAGQSGQLNKVDVEVWRGPSVTASSAPLVLEIHRGIPSNPAVLGSATITPLTPSLYPTPAFVSVDLAGAGILVQAGQSYSIVLKAEEPTGIGINGYGWTATASGLSGYPGPFYPSGNAWYSGLTTNDVWVERTQPESDHGFRTYVVEVPEPNTFLCSVLVSVMLIGRQRCLRG